MTVNYNFHAVAHAFALSEKHDLNASERILLISIGRMYNNDRNAAWPSIGKLATMTGLGETSVKKYLRSLDDKGLIVRDKDKSEGKRYTHNLFRFPGYTPSAEKRSGTLGSTARFDPIGTGSAPQTAGYFT